MNNPTAVVKYAFNVNEDIISNNMMLYVISINSLIDRNFSESNGFVILDIDNIKTPQHGVIYGMVKCITDICNIDLNDYNIVLRNSVIYTEDYNVYSGYGEYHDIIKSDGSIENDCGDYQLLIYYNDTDDIISFSTDITKNNEEKYPEINEITFFRPQQMSIFMKQHLADCNLVEYENVELNEIRQGALHRSSIDFISKSKGQVKYPKLSEIIKDEQELYDSYGGYCKLFDSNIELFVNNTQNKTLEDIELIGNILDNNIQCCTDNMYMNAILERHNSSFEKLYKSLFPGSYDIEEFEKNENEEIYRLDYDIGNEITHKCVGQYKVSQNTRNILKEMHSYMKTKNCCVMTITK